MPYAQFLWSVALPVCLLAVMALVLPILLVPRRSRSQALLAKCVLVSALLLLGIGTVFMAVLYIAEGAEVEASIRLSPLQTLLFFVKRSAMTSLIWGPLLALSWFSMAQKIERLKGKDGMRVGLGHSDDEAVTDDAGDATDATKQSTNDLK